MVRNFGILKILLLRPTRSDQYRMEPLDVTLTATAITAIGMLNIGSKKRPRIRSNVRFAYEPALRALCSPRTIGVPLALAVDSVTCCCINCWSSQTEQEVSRRLPAK